MTEFDKEKKYKKAFHHFLGKMLNPAYTRIESGMTDSLTHILKNDNFPNRKAISCVFTHHAKLEKVGETYYDTSCKFQFQNMPSDDLTKLFNNNTYNYELIQQVLMEFIKIGQEFKFFTTYTPINDFKISDSYSKGVYYCSESVRALTKITLTSLIAAKTLNGHEKKKTVIYHLGFKVSVNNRIEPVLSLSIPYTMNKSMLVSINIHPSKKEEMIKTIPSILSDFKILLTEHIDILLNKSLKLKKADILKLTLEEKMSYLPLVEMVKF
jgi:hypothetical protein